MKHELKVNASTLVFSLDGKILASAGYSRVVRLWDIKRKEQVNEIKEDYWIYSMSFSPDGKNLAYTGNGKPIKIWQVAE